MPHHRQQRFAETQASVEPVACGTQPAPHNGTLSCESSRSAPMLQSILKGRKVRRLDLQNVEIANPVHAVFDVVEATRRRAGGVLAVGIVDAAVARAHEQAGLGKPLYRTAQVSAVDSEDPELL